LVLGMREKRLEEHLVWTELELFPCPPPQGKQQTGWGEGGRDAPGIEAGVVLKDTRCAFTREKRTPSCMRFIKLINNKPWCFL
jgi:hypothetical protein